MWDVIVRYMGTFCPHVYSDYQEILGADANNYVKMSIAYVDAPDADKGKVFRIWKSRYI